MIKDEGKSNGKTTCEICLELLGEEVFSQIEKLDIELGRDVDDGRKFRLAVNYINGLSRLEFGSHIYLH